jgi:molybdate transport system substrate-binding protein
MTDSYASLGYRTARSRRIQVALPLLLAAACAQAQQPAQPPTELHIAAASDLQPVLPALAARYVAETGVKIVASFGSSATLTGQLENGAPQDVFLSADYIHPEQLVAAGLAVETVPVPYARGVLVLWARKDSPAQPLTLDALTNPRVTKIAIANPLHAPYGLAATSALESLHLTGVTKSKLVIAENIGQTAQFAESANAQVAIISLTIASSPHYQQLGSFVRFPPSSYPVIRQCGVVLKASKNQATAEAFLQWLTSAAVQESLPRFGLDPTQ